MERGNDRSFLYNSMAPSSSEEEEEKEFSPGNYYTGLVVFDPASQTETGTHLTITFRENASEEDVLKMTTEAKMISACLPMSFEITGTQMMGKEKDIFAFLVKPKNEKDFVRIEKYHNLFERRESPYPMVLHVSANNEKKKLAMDNLENNWFTVTKIYVRGLFKDKEGNSSAGEKMFIV